MDAFEDLVARLLRGQNYWVRQNYMIDITKSEKKEIGQPSMPRPEVDIIAYQAAENRVLWVECKSYLNSKGVQFGAVTDPGHAHAIKIFVDPEFRAIVSYRLQTQLVERRLVRPNPTIDYWLVAGRVAPQSVTPIEDHFAQNGWTLRQRPWIVDRLGGIAAGEYEDDVVAMAAKLLTP